MAERYTETHAILGKVVEEKERITTQFLALAEQHKIAINRIKELELEVAEKVEVVEVVPDNETGEGKPNRKQKAH